MGVQSRKWTIVRVVITAGVLFSMLLAGGAPSDFAHGIPGGDLSTPDAVTW